MGEISIRKGNQNGGSEQFVKGEKLVSIEEYDIIKQPTSCGTGRKLPGPQNDGGTAAKECGFARRNLKPIKKWALIVSRTQKQIKSGRFLCCRHLQI